MQVAGVGADARASPRAWCSSSRGCSRGARSAATSTWRSSTRRCRGSGAPSGGTNCCSGSGWRAPRTARSGRSAAGSSSASRSRGRWPRETPLFLLDEPFAALDALTRERLQEDVRQVSAESGRTTVFVTHSADEAAFLGSRIVVLTRRPGQVALDLPVDLPRTGVDPDELAALPGVHPVARRGRPRGQGRRGLAATARARDPIVGRAWDSVRPPPGHSDHDRVVRIPGEGLDRRIGGGRVDARAAPREATGRSTRSRRSRRNPDSDPSDTSQRDERVTEV